MKNTHPTHSEEIKYSPLYRRERSPFWYAQWPDPDTGKMIRKSTGKVDREDALCEYYAMIREFSKKKNNQTFGEYLTIYMDPRENPLYKECKDFEGHYSYQHSVHIARCAKDIGEMLNRESPEFMRKNLREFTCSDVKTIREMIVRNYGKCGASYKKFIFVKSFFNQAFKNNLLDYNPAIGLSNIRYTKKERISLEAEDVRDIISLRDILPSPIWAFVTVAVTTGMRRGEILAMRPCDLDGNVYVVDRAVRMGENSRREISKPKWGKTRIIILSKLTMSALRRVWPKKADDFFFPMSTNSTVTYIGKLVVLLNTLFPEKKDKFDKLTMHAFRHTLCTCLSLTSNLPGSVIDSYLGWSEDAGDIGMRRNYVHVMASHLVPVAEFIDRTFTPEKYLENPAKRKIETLTGYLYY